MSSTARDDTVERRPDDRAIELALRLVDCGARPQVGGRLGLRGKVGISVQLRESSFGLLLQRNERCLRALQSAARNIKLLSNRILAHQRLISAERYRSQVLLCLLRSDLAENGPVLRFRRLLDIPASLREGGLGVVQCDLERMRVEAEEVRRANALSFVHVDVLYQPRYICRNHQLGGVHRRRPTIYSGRPSARRTRQANQ